jgi:hypothetical protein
MKLLFSFMLKSRIGDEVTECFQAEKRVSDAALGSNRRWPWEHQTQVQRLVANPK